MQRRERAQWKLIKAWGTFELIHFARIKRFPFSADVIKSWWLAGCTGAAAAADSQRQSAHGIGFAKCNSMSFHSERIPSSAPALRLDSIIRPFSSLTGNGMDRKVSSCPDSLEITLIHFECCSFCNSKYCLITSLGVTLYGQVFFWPLVKIKFFTHKYYIQFANYRQSKNVSLVGVFIVQWIYLIFKTSEQVIQWKNSYFSTRRIQSHLEPMKVNIFYFNLKMKRNRDAMVEG